jgi:hypothetical protein
MSTLIGWEDRDGALDLRSLYYFMVDSFLIGSKENLDDLKEDDDFRVSIIGKWNT